MNANQINNDQLEGQISILNYHIQNRPLLSANNFTLVNIDGKIALTCPSMKFAEQY